MTGACAAIVPSRGRPGVLSQLLDAFGDTAVCTDLIVCLDEDDPDLDQYKTVLGARRFARHKVSWRVGPRAGLTEWTNRVAGRVCGDYEALISLGDDHRPVTPAWDRKLLDHVRAMGGGWAYGDDGLQHENLPTAFLVTSKIVAALGWMLLPGCKHMCVDAAARDLAAQCGRLRYDPDVSVKHLHYTSGLSPLDQTYVDGYASWTPDHAAYRAWLGTPEGTGPIAADADTVRRTCEQTPQ